MNEISVAMSSYALVDMAKSFGGINRVCNFVHDACFLYNHTQYKRSSIKQCAFYQSLNVFLTKELEYIEDMRKYDNPYPNPTEGVWDEQNLALFCERLTNAIYVLECTIALNDIEAVSKANEVAKDIGYLPIRQCLEVAQYDREYAKDNFYYWCIDESFNLLPAPIHSEAIRYANATKFCKAYTHNDLFAMLPSKLLFQSGKAFRVFGINEDKPNDGDIYYLSYSGSGKICYECTSKSGKTKIDVVLEVDINLSHENHVQDLAGYVVHVFEYLKKFTNIYE